MLQNRIKYKITLWYTGILTLVLALGILSVTGYTEYCFRKDARNELYDELSDFGKDLGRITDPETELLNLNYYDDSVTLAIFNQEGELVRGLYPDGFPLDYPFKNDALRNVRKNNEFWMVLDRSFSIAGQEYQVRAVYTLSLVEAVLGRILPGMILMAVVLLLCAALIGYRMLRKALYPIYTMNQMVNDITNSSDLSLRLPEATAKDELSCLTETFNYMLNHLEEMFKRETEFTSDAAHELRTPISVIISHCEYCLEELDLSAELREELEIISRKASAMSDLVSQLLMIARNEGGSYRPDFEETDLNVLIETVLDELGEKAQACGITLRFQYEEEHTVIVCDFNLVMRMLINLIGNGIHYGRPNGHVTVKLEKGEKGCWIRVRDDGIGIPAECVDKIWNRFYQVDESHNRSEGFGLGLPMVKWIAELHGGRAEVKSMLDIGSIFSVYLPFSPGNTQSTHRVN